MTHRLYFNALTVGVDRTVSENNLHKEAEQYLNSGKVTGIDNQLLEIVETGADRILGEVGLRFQDDPETLDVLKGIGGILEGDIVRLDGSALRAIIRRSAPSRFLLRGRNPVRDTSIGEGYPAVFAPMYGAPDVLFPDGKRARGTKAVYRDLLVRTHNAPTLTNTSHMLCVMDDVPEQLRPLEMLRMHLTLSDKPMMGPISSPADIAEYSEIVTQAVNRPAAPAECNLLHLINCTPPLTYWPNPLKCIRQIALSGEAAMVSSYMMMGATSPATVIGALIQGYAEVLAGMALCQIWRPGTPVVMGVLGWPFDMRSMLPNFGDPASRLLQFHAVALARRLGVPARGDGAVTSSKADDGQAAAEGAMNLSAAVHSGANFILHSAGWLQQGRCISLGKFGRDAVAIEDFAKNHHISTDLEKCDTEIEIEVSRRLGCKSASI